MAFTDQFPILNTCTYLNTASSGLLSQSQVDWRTSHDLEFLTHGSGFRVKQAEFLQEVKRNVADFFKAKAVNTFLVPNFSFGFNTLLSGLASKQRFLLLKEDYPSVNYAIEVRGNICDYVPLTVDLEQHIVEKIKEFKPTVFVFSLVQYISGIKVDLSFLKDLKRSFPELLIVADGTQFCGSEEFDFEDSGLDVLISSGYKWMLSGYGNGFVLLKDQAVELLYDGARNRPTPKEPFLAGRPILATFFEPGHLDTLAFGTLNKSIEFFKTIDFPKTTFEAQSIAKRAKEAFNSLNLLQDTVAKRPVHSNILSLSGDIKLYHELTQENIICLPRGNGIRIAFHIYNTYQDLEILLNILKNNY